MIRSQERDTVQFHEMKDSDWAMLTCVALQQSLLLLLSLALLSLRLLLGRPSSPLLLLRLSPPHVLFQGLLWGEAGEERVKNIGGVQKNNKQPA